jgi:septum formation protein
MLALRKIVLASNSPRRIELLKKLGVLFSVMPSDFDEELVQHDNPAEVARLRALGKALDVALRLQEGIVLGADTIVVLDGKVFGKPENATHAKRMLRKLSGKTHSVFSGVALVNAKTKAKESAVDESKVKFRKLTIKEIDRYVATRECFGKAGSYAIQGKASVLIEGYDGSLSNIVGLPLEKLKPLLDKMYW